MAKKSNAHKEFITHIRSQLKVTNQRLRRLEKANLDTHAYRQAVANIQQMGGKNRFFVKESMSFQELQRVQANINLYNRSSSSTVGGVKKYVREREKSLRENYGAVMKKHKSLQDWKQAHNFFKSIEYKKALELGVSSEQIVKQMFTLDKDPRRLKKVIRESLKNGRSEYIYQDIDDYVNNVNGGKNGTLQQKDNSNPPSNTRTRIKIHNK